jgi:hypothetical protein
MVKQEFVDKRDETDSVFDSLMAQLTESGKQFDKLLTKKEFHQGCDKIKRGQRKILALATHILEQERAGRSKPGFHYFPSPRPSPIKERGIRKPCSKTTGNLKLITDSWLLPAVCALFHRSLSIYSPGLEMENSAERMCVSPPKPSSLPFT